MKNHLITICIFLFTYVQSQQLIPLNEKNYSDSLKTVVNSKVDNNAKANSYFLLSNFYRNTDSLLSKNYLEKGKVLSSKIALNTSKYHYYEGWHFLESNKEKAAVSFQKAIQEFSKIKSLFKK